MKLRLGALALIAIAATFLLSLAAPVPDAGITKAAADPGTLGSLFRDLNTFAAQHHLETSELLKELTQINIRQQLMAKGSVGIIRPGLYVDTASETNLILINGQWFSQTSTNQGPGIFVVSKGRVVGDVVLQDGQQDDLVIVIYTALGVSFLDWNSGNAGTYHRHR